MATPIGIPAVRMSRRQGRIRVGALSDTHVGDMLPRLPEEVLELLDGADLILHAGDLTEPATLQPLRAIAPVVAVQGNHDQKAGVELPRTAVVTIGDLRIGLIHGHRQRALEAPAAVLSLATRRVQLLGLLRWLRRRLGDVDVVVFGHLHMALARELDGVLFFSPGAVYQPEVDPTIAWDGLAGRAARRFRDAIPHEDLMPSVGMLEISAAGVHPRVLRLRGPIRPPVPDAGRWHRGAS